MADRTKEIIARMDLAGQLLPEVEDLVEFARACSRDEALAPVLAPSAFMRGSRRLEALKRLAWSAAEYFRLWDEFRETMGDEGDPERDEIAAAELLALYHRLGDAAEPDESPYPGQYRRRAREPREADRG